jgi:hypothetical protein
MQPAGPKPLAEPLEVVGVVGVLGELVSAQDIC